MHLRNTLLLLFALASISCFGFDFTATSQPASCPGKGHINMTVSNTTQNGFITFYLYKLPDTITPIGITSNLTFNNLMAGDYLVVASESVGTTTSTQQIQLTISNEYIPLQVESSNIIATSTLCSPNSNLSITPTSGNQPFMFEIISGPQTFPLQVSNTFTNLVPGTYAIKVWDACDNAQTQTYTVINNLLPVKVSNPVVTRPNPSDCSLVNVANTITAATNLTIAYPLVIEYTVDNPAGGTTVFNQTITSGNTTNTTINQIIPNYTNSNYSYTLVITDNCGITVTKTFQIKQPQPFHTESIYNCLSTNGYFTLKMQRSTLVDAVILSGPAGVFTYPHNIGSQIVNGSVTINNLPIGTYIVQPYDNCATVLIPVTIVIPPYLDIGFSSSVRPGCGLSLSSININGNGGTLVTATITNAPVAFSSQNTLPFNVNNQISLGNGQLYLDNLPEGDYTISYADSCQKTGSITVTATGYKVLSSNINIVPGCGNFDIAMSYNINSNTGKKLWLQKLIDPANNIWGHPDFPHSGNVYNDGDVLTLLTAKDLINNTTNYNNSFGNGTFRILCTFFTFNNGISINNGSNIDKQCLEVLKTFNYNQSLEIIDVYRLPGSAPSSLNIVVIATGYGVIQYSLYDANNNLIVNNGSNNVFMNLASGDYKIRVEDSCKTLTQSIGLADLTTLIVVNTPNDMFTCDSNSVFNLDSQIPTILGSQRPNLYTVSFFETLANAQNNSNPILNSNAYRSNATVQTIYVRIIFNTLPNYFETTTFKLYTGQTPVLNISPNYHECNNNQITLDASVGNLSTTTYQWINNENGNVIGTNSSLTISEIGITNITVIATNSYGNIGTCTNTKTTNVTLSIMPVFDHIDSVDWTENDNSISVFTTNNSAFEYSIDGNSWQTSNTFTGLEPGVYTVSVRDIWHCGEISKTVALYYYQRFFTPNGDGANDYWYIKYSNLEPTMDISIFDRYGRLIKNFKGNNGSWDGTLNGELLPSDDYWFSIKRADGREHLGHFAMKR